MTTRLSNFNYKREKRRKKSNSLFTTSKLLRRDAFGNVVFLKRSLISLLATTTYWRFNIFNKLEVEGMEHLENLPDTNVLFISNHQTYYSDVIAFYHVFSSAKWGFNNHINLPLYVLSPRANTYYVAAEETMKQSGLLPKIFSLTGAVTVRRSWRSKGQSVNRGADTSAPDKIKKALSEGWVVNFPQGTTSPYAPIRKGTANLIKSFEPVVVPIVIDGFRRAFDKKGLKLKKRGSTLRVRIKPPMNYQKDDKIEDIVAKVQQEIEQVRPETVS
ncbi:lysophospholipid acyltransferase family protein [Sediminitomix flava]|uniref:1-acyl-sn-glycerol-3-phosphate acyltransferase n=1 Tax=Sediminitomix flava TaxID=379075 RepID=A0A315ZIF0_SEDFL|nr:lysophospholipid acyltransferase family protein [Sediminitomix flava]PWJ44880.1 1-acyl-sn-glycerol-3-phosphate acyltransferase [Sediminitomix flava]